MAATVTAKRMLARHFHKGRVRPLRLIVWHDMEAPETNTRAEQVAAWWHGPSSPETSAHVAGDPNSVVECVLPGDTAWAAPNANADGYQVEVAGYRDQGRAGWRDASSLATLRLLCQWIAQVPELRGIPDRWLTDAQVKDRKSKGHTTHEQVTRVLGGGHGHTDPGPDFPKDYVMAELARARGVTVKPAAVKPAPDRVLRVTTPRMTGQDVKNVQNALVVAGNDHLDVDGVYGPVTARVIATFQANRNYPASGVVDAETWRALRAVILKARAGGQTDA